MKKYFLTLLFLFAVVSVSNSADLKKYQIKSGIVEYKISGMQTGTQTLYFDNWGMLSAQYTNASMSFMGFASNIETLDITDMEWTYNINLVDKTGKKTANKDILEMMGRLNKDDAENFGAKMMEELGAKKLGEEVYFGKNCEIWQIEKLGSKIWTYKWVALKMEINLMGNILFEATKFEENASVDPEKFKVPDGITITEQKMTEEEKKSLEEMMKMLGK